MSGTQIHVDDAAFLRGLERAVARHAATSADVVGDIGQQVANATRSAAPHRTGLLRRSIKSTPGHDARGPYAEVSVGPFYASFIEFGAVTTPMRPYFRPALAQAARLLRGSARRFR